MSRIAPAFLKFRVYIDEVIFIPLFVCIAEKEWYKNYFIDVYPKLEKGGCYTAHNVSTGGWGMGAGIREFFDYIKSLPYMKTTVDESGGGISISYKRE